MGRKSEGEGEGERDSEEKSKQQRELVGGAERNSAGCNYPEPINDKRKVY